MKLLSFLTAAWFAGLPLLAADTGKAAAPARVERPGKETDLANLTLTAEAEKRLGVRTTPVERRTVERTRLFGGEMILPAARGESGPASASQQTVFTILPSLTPADLIRLAQSQIDADGQVEQAQVQWDAAKVGLARAEQLLRDMAGSARAVDDARAAAASAEVGWRTARARRELLGPPVLNAAAQSVLWIRVPVYVGDLSTLDLKADARVGGLVEAQGATALAAKPVAAPPSANAAASTVDLFYEMTDTNRVLRLGQKVGVTIRRQDDGEGLVVPWSAVVFDVHGGAWVYENIGPLSYARRRVQVRHVDGDLAVLVGGLKAGANIVTTGVAELFGTEFGVGK